MIAKINNCIQRRLQEENLSEVSLRVAAHWLVEDGILKNSAGEVGFQLRRYFNYNDIFGSFKKGNFWYIRRIIDYQEILGAQDLSKVFGLKSRTSIYRKIKEEEIPFSRLRRKGIYFTTFDLMKWAIKKNYMSLYEKFQAFHKENE